MPFSENASIREEFVCSLKEEATGAWNAGFWTFLCVAVSACKLLLLLKCVELMGRKTIKINGGN